MSNTFIKSSSPYVLQHAKQEIDWHPWSKETFELAKDRNLPILLSIGYASCHWCQKMSRECFEDSFVASLMNRHFICIIVDREERPDLDQIYLESVRMFNQTAGWPLNIFCLPNGHPFWGGTFFPKEDDGSGIAPWPQVLMRISEHFRKAKSELEENAKNVMANLQHANHPDFSNSSSWNPAHLIEASTQISKSHDDEHGGYTQAPKFPGSITTDFLLALLESQSMREDIVQAQRLEFCVRKTLSGMISGSLFDHINGGIFRYSEDRQWLNPHFEKMLSDNAIFLSTVSRAYRKNNNLLYKYAVEKTIGFLFSTMGTSKTGMGSSLSSEIQSIEGAKYLWERENLEQALNSSEDGLFLVSKLIPFADDKNLFLPHLISSQELPYERQFVIFEQLQSRVHKETKPRIDSKKLVGANALLIRALVDASIAFENPSFFLRARELDLWMQSTFSINSENIPNSSILFLQDFTLWIEAILSLASVCELFEEGMFHNYLSRAENLTKEVIRHFKDKKMPGYFISPETIDYPPPCRKKIWHDDAVPSGNSSLMRIFSHLSELTENSQMKIELGEAKNAYSNLLSKSPTGLAWALTALSEDAVGIVTIASNHFSKDTIGTISSKPHRPIYFRSDNSIKNTKVYLNGKIALTTQSVEEALDSIYE